MNLFEFTLRRLTVVPSSRGCLPIRLLFFFTIQKRPIASTLRYRLTSRAAAFLAKKNLFAKIQLAWSVLHGVDSLFRTTTINFRCSSLAMSVPSWHDRHLACHCNNIHIYLVARPQSRALVGCDSCWLAPRPSLSRPAVSFS